MEEKIKRSEELRYRINNDGKLLKVLSKTISKILKGKVDIADDETFAFVPIVYKKPVFAPEAFTTNVAIGRIPFGGAGPLDPDILVVLENFRVMDSNPIPADTLREQILGNRALMKDLSEGISEVLREHDVKFEADETYAFLPIVLKKAIFGPELFISPRMRPEPVTWKPSAASPLVAKPLGRVSTIVMIEEYGIIPSPLPGPLDPDLLHMLDKFRIGKMR
ncbi:MAG: hypothetical protein ACXQTR_04110 [Candidatus Methanospirareceae archaeon]